MSNYYHLADQRQQTHTLWNAISDTFWSVIFLRVLLGILVAVTPIITILILFLGATVTNEVGPVAGAGLAFLCAGSFIFFGLRFLYPSMKNLKGPITFFRLILALSPIITTVLVIIGYPEPLIINWLVTACGCLLFVWHVGYGNSTDEKLSLIACP